MPAYQPLADAQLDQLLGPVALYPDPLIAQILPASTLPAQIVLADRYVSGGGDPNQIDQQPWDPSVQALARYPNVLAMDGPEPGLDDGTGTGFSQPAAGRDGLPSSGCASRLTISATCNPRRSNRWLMTAATLKLFRPIRR
jgi:hypothetical protein